jgi:ABC-type nitrate/sulfonate/bicarbonate transport system substrate-binding protein
LAVGLALLVAGAPVAGGAADPRLVRFSFTGGWEALPALVAIERGFLAQEDVVVSGLTVSSSEALLHSLAAGSTDFAAVPQRAFLTMVAANAPIKVVSMNGWGTEFELVAAKDDGRIKTIGDLKGKTVAMTAASDGYPFLIRLLNKARMRPSDVRVRFLAPGELARGFQGTTRPADAILESKHFTAPLVRGGGGKVVLRHRDIVEAIGVIGAAALVARAAVLEREPETAQRFVNGWVRALKYIRQDADDAARLLVIFFHRQGAGAVPEEVARSWIDATRYDRAVWSPADVADAEYNGWGLKEGGLLKEAPKLAAYIENRFAREALKALGEPGGG